MTNSKRLSETRRLSAIVHASGDAMCSIDLAGRFIDWNPAAERLFGYTRSEVEGQPASLLAVPGDEDCQQNLIQGAQRGDIFNGVETKRQHKNGTAMSIAMSVFPIRDDKEEIVGVAASFRDLTTVQRLLDEQKRLNERLTKLSARLLEAQEEERGRIARELHDSVGQTLAASLMHLNKTDKSVLGAHNDALDTIRETLRQALDEIHHISHGLRPAVLDDSGLCGAIESYVGTFQAKSRIPVTLSLDIDEELLSEDARTHVYRIIQESLFNVSRHARANKIEVSMVSSSQECTMLVADDGIGFRVDGVDTRNHQGLLGMEERAKLLRGGLTVFSSQGEGTKVELRFPLTAEN